MKKSDLKSKMFVELENRERYIVIDDVLLSKEGFELLSEYDEDLTRDDCVGYDIIKIYRFDNDLYSFTNGLGIGSHTLEFNFEYSCYELLWEREEDIDPQEIVDYLNTLCHKDFENHCTKYITTMLGGQLGNEEIRWIVDNYTYFMYDIDDMKLKVLSIKQKLNVDWTKNACNCDWKYFNSHKETLGWLKENITLAKSKHQEMTIEEIEQQLGYKIKIVGEE